MESWNNMDPITITKEEAVIVRDLINIYEYLTTYRHSLTCRCEMCTLMQKVDNSDNVEFDSLHAKVSEVAS